MNSTLYHDQIERARPRADADDAFYDFGVERALAYQGEGFGQREPKHEWHSAEEIAQTVARGEAQDAASLSAGLDEGGPLLFEPVTDYDLPSWALPVALLVTVLAVLASMLWPWGVALPL